MVSSRNPEPLAPTVRPGLVWLGATGAALIVGGIASMLAANWHCVPFGAQVAVALAPLAAGWGGFAWLRGRRVASSAAEDVVGVVCAGGVLCAVALLGRVLQLGSSAPAFCGTMALLLAPVAYAVRSHAAALACAGFCLATNWAWLDAHHYSPGQWMPIPLALWGAGVALFLPKLRRIWRETGGVALADRWLAALFAVPATVSLAIDLVWLMPEENLFAICLGILALGTPLALSAFLERERRWFDRPLGFLGALMLTLPVRHLAEAMRLACAQGGDFSSPGMLAGCLLATAAAGASCRKRLRGEGMFLLLIPVCLWSVYLDLGVLPVTALHIAVGVAAIASGVLARNLLLANLGLFSTLCTLWAAFSAYNADLMLHGLLLVGSGAAVVVLNLVLALRQKQGGRP